MKNVSPKHVEPARRVSRPAVVAGELSKQHGGHPAAERRRRHHHEVQLGGVGAAVALLAGAAFVHFPNTRALFQMILRENENSFRFF